MKFNFLMVIMLSSTSALTYAKNSSKSREAAQKADLAKYEPEFKKEIFNKGRSIRVTIQNPNGYIVNPGLSVVDVSRQEQDGYCSIHLKETSTNTRVLKEGRSFLATSASGSFNIENQTHRGGLTQIEDQSIQSVFFLKSSQHGEDIGSFSLEKIKEYCDLKLEVVPDNSPAENVIEEI